MWFNPLKLVCLIRGQNPFTTTPIWTIDNNVLKIEENLSYLGSVIGDSSGFSHCVARTRASTKAFYGLQGADISYPGVNPKVACNLYEVAVRSVIQFGCACINITKQTWINLMNYNLSSLNSVLVLAQGVAPAPYLKL